MKRMIRSKVMFTMFDAAFWAALTLVTLLATAATAANTWDGGGTDNKWSTADNWDDNTVPTFPAALTFAGTTRTSPSNDLSGITVTGMTFLAGGAKFAIYGNPIDITGGMTIDNPSANINDFNCAFTGNGALIKSGTGTIALKKASSHTGGLTINLGGVFGNSEQVLGAVPATPQTNLVFAGNEAQFNANGSFTLNANRMIALANGLKGNLNAQSYTLTVNGEISGGAGSVLQLKGQVGTTGGVVLAPGEGRTNVLANLKVLSGNHLIANGTTLITNPAAQFDSGLHIFANSAGAYPTLTVGGGLLKTISGPGATYGSTQNGALVVTNGIADFTSLNEYINAYAATGSVTVCGSGVLDVKLLRPTNNSNAVVAVEANVINVNTGGTIRLIGFNADMNITLLPKRGCVSLNGGTLAAKQNNDIFLGNSTDAATFQRYLTNVFFYVREGGAIFDSGTYTIAASMPLYKGATVDGGLTKRGSGLLKLAYTNTYTGVTRVEAGTLRLNLSDLLPSSNSVFVAADAVFDVNGKEQTLAGLAGSGLVTNNSLLSVTDSVTPGGAAATGTLTLAATPAALGGTFLADVAADGAYDRLHVQGDLDLSTLDLQVANPDDLNRNHKYTIASCTGNLTGAFRSAPLPARWNVIYNRDSREVFLRYNFGTLISVF